MKKLLLALAAALALSACSEDAPVSLKGKNFTLVNDKNITLSFDKEENRFAGKALNNYFGTYLIENQNITLNLAGSTMMADPKEEMEKEQTYFKDLGKIKTYTFKNKTLELKGDNVTLKFIER